MNEKFFQIGGWMALSMAVVVTLLTMLEAVERQINLGTIGFMLWAIAPYICFSAAVFLLSKFTSLARMPLIFFVISVLMLVLTLLAYVGIPSDESSTAALVFVFVPLYLFIGSFLLLGGGLILTLLFKPRRSENI